MEHIIEISHLQKAFGAVQAVNDLSFHVRRGELFAFLGVNGAGKSTTISILCGQLRRDSGIVTVCGKSIDGGMGEITRRLGVVFQNSVLDQLLTVQDNLQSRAALYGITGTAFQKRLQELTALFDLGGLLDRTVGKLSGGQRRRVDIARALLHRPEILILDEPTTGLDPQTRQLLWRVVQDLRREEQLTVFLTTHYMEEAADADYVVILDTGRIAAEGTPLDLKNAWSGDFITFYGLQEPQIARLEQEGRRVERLSGAVRVEVSDPRAATEWIQREPELFCDYEISKGKMDDVFLAVTGKRLRYGSDDAKEERK